MFYATGVFLYFSSIISFLKKKPYLRLTLFCMLFLFGLSALRYSLGADYYSYAIIFERMPDKILEALKSTVHSDPGFKVLIALFKQLGISYQWFIVFLSAVTLYGFFEPIIKKSQLPLLSLAIFYSVYYHIYINSALRQGLAMAIIFFAVNYFYNEGKNRKFILLVLIAGTFHISSLVILTIYPLSYLIRNKVLVYSFLIAALAFIFIANASPYIDFIINYFVNLVGYSVYIEGQINMLSVVTKISLLTFISVLYFLSGKNKSEEDKFYYRLYVTGTLIYLVFPKYPIVARILDYFAMFEVLLIPSLLIKIKDIPLRIVGVFLTLTIFSVIIIKDFYSFTFQEHYYSNSLFNYQYISVFNKELESEIKSMHPVKIYLPMKYY